MMLKNIVITVIAGFIFTSCRSKDPNTLKVAATHVPHAQMLELAKVDLEKEGIRLKILEVDDYQLPNRALNEHEVDANFFQHIPFLEQQIATFNYQITCFAKIHLEPLGLYSIRWSALQEIPEGSIIAIPNDPANESRALMLCEKAGLLKLDNPNNEQFTVMNIKENPKQLRFKEIDAAFLSRALEDVSLAAIPTNFALQANLNPMEDAIVIEDSNSPYANILAIRLGDDQDPKLLALKKAMLSEKMRAFILEKYQGTILPVLTDCN